MFRKTKLLGISMVSRRNRRFLVIGLYLVLGGPVLFKALCHPAGFHNDAMTILFVSILISRVLLGRVVGEFTFAKRETELADTSGPEIVHLTGTSAKSKHVQTDAPLDERDISVRNRIYFRSFQTIAAYTVLLWIATIFLLDTAMPGSELRMTILQFAMYPLLLLVCTLPQAMTLWNEPDMVGEE